MNIRKGETEQVSLLFLPKASGNAIKALTRFSRRGLGNHSLASKEWFSKKIFSLYQKEQP